MILKGTKHKESTASATLRIKYVRSAIGTPSKHKLIIKSLGFKRLNQVVTRVDTPAIRGMVARVPHLVAIVDSE
jgi:large subunit ribosomal protein L30